MIQKNLNPKSPDIAKQIAKPDKNFDVIYFQNQRQAIVDKYNLKK